VSAALFAASEYGYRMGDVEWLEAHPSNDDGER